MTAALLDRLEMINVMCRRQARYVFHPNPSLSEQFEISSPVWPRLGPFDVLIRPLQQNPRQYRSFSRKHPSLTYFMLVCHHTVHQEIVRLIFSGYSKS